MKYVAPQFYRICHPAILRQEHLNILSYSPLTVLNASSEIDGKRTVPGNPWVKHVKTRIRLCILLGIHTYIALSGNLSMGHVPANSCLRGQEDAP